MYDKILSTVTGILKQIKPDGTIYLDSVMQSNQPLYFVLSIEEGGTENVGITIQNASFLVDIAIVDNKENKKLVRDLTAQCGSFFNVLEIDGNQLFPENYLPYKSDGVQHVSFSVAFPQQIEWSEL